MKYLRLYEEYSEKLYHEISASEWHKFSQHDTKSEITGYEISQMQRFGEVKENKLFIIVIIGDAMIDIAKNIDDYFYIRAGLRYFKCDTIDGVVEFLRFYITVVYDRVYDKG